VFQQNIAYKNATHIFKVNQQQNMWPAALMGQNESTYWLEIVKFGMHVESVTQYKIFYCVWLSRLKLFTQEYSTLQNLDENQ
jgi:hypothetical protein